ncbi:probable serine carboxypeptidase CPVL isoform X2 [Patella vulgata]|uniref:probable serine carboxypeptidase CPVL isoform X2 n=1 Tax=Patella vulgata TaxID=6465 RepID=UPI0024A98312|nr:probable serine carboxypeptidase CPVL isoform X2 [Patella vulgata]XP_050388515.2 probable serine carboxypeptidase CPVL isoform X2 [Patella vulgata]
MVQQILAVVILVTLATIHSGESARALRRMFPSKIAPMWQNGVDPGEPAFLTPYLEKGEIDKARQVSLVSDLRGIPIKSYSGLLTVNETYNSNMYFWFFPAQVNPADAPVLLWLQGGPGGSSLFGLFVEHGPYTVLENGTLTRKNVTWNEKYSMLYIDNPVGTGFSFTKDDRGYATNEVDVGINLYKALVQFFQIYPEFQKNEFYVTGESYAGKYVPAISYRIHLENPAAKVKINFKGMAIGDGLCDPETMMSQYAPFMFSIGTLDENQRDYFQNLSDIAVQDIKAGRYMDAFKIFDELLNGDETTGPPFYQQATGSTDYYNFLRIKSPDSFGYYNNLLADPSVRKAIHVGNLTYNDGSTVEKYLTNDFMQSVKPWISVLLDNYKVMIYNGQLDIIIAVPLTEAWLQTVPWSGLEKYKSVERNIWNCTLCGGEIAGYYRQVDNFYQVIVLGAGHILPHDQPLRGYEMIQRFVENRSFS